MLWHCPRARLYGFGEVMSFLNSAWSSTTTKSCLWRQLKTRPLQRSNAQLCIVVIRHHLSEPVSDEDAALAHVFDATFNWCILCLTWRLVDGGIYIFGSSDSNQAGQQVDKEMNISTPLKIPILDSNKQPVEVSQLSVSRTLCAAVSKEYGRAFVWGWQVSKTPLHIAKSYMGHKQCQHVCCGKGTILVYCDL